MLNTKLMKLNQDIVFHFFLHPSPDTILKSTIQEDDVGVLAHDFLDERLKAIKLY